MSTKSLLILTMAASLCAVLPATAQLSAGPDPSQPAGDPLPGEVKEYRIPVLGGPHGLINDKDGNIWYGGNWGGHIGKLDVKTGEYKIYPMPDPKAKDPHTPLFDRDGVLWFSVQNGGFMGRLDPATGDIK